MITQDDPTAAGGLDERGWDQGGGETLELPPGPAAPADPEEEISVAGDEDLDELDAVIDPDFHEAETWDFEDLDSDLDIDLDEGDEAEDEDEDEDEAEIRLLHELGIDLDAPDGAVGADLVLGLEQDDHADEGVAA